MQSKAVNFLGWLALVAVSKLHIRPTGLHLQLLKVLVFQEPKTGEPFWEVENPHAHLGYMHSFQTSRHSRIPRSGRSFPDPRVFCAGVLGFAVARPGELINSFHQGLAKPCPELFVLQSCSWDLIYSPKLHFCFPCVDWQEAQLLGIGDHIPSCH